jgi:hypothetical protein
MKRDLAKKKGGSKHSKRRLWIVLIALLLIFGGVAIGFFIYQAKNKLTVPPAISSLSSHVSDWIAERKTRLKDNLAKVKKITVNNKEPNQEIHFEFYTALQTMKVTVGDAANKPLANNKADNKNDNNPEVFASSSLKAVKVEEANGMHEMNITQEANEASEGKPSTSSRSPTSKKPATMKSAKSLAIFDADQLENALNEEFKPESKLRH